jgi:hypothetical protein
MAYKNSKQIGYRGVFDIERVDPFRISRSKIDLFLNCERCFWLETISRGREAFRST